MERENKNQKIMETKRNKILQLANKAKSKIFTLFTYVQ